MPSAVFLRRVLLALLLVITLAGVGRAAPPATVAGKDAFAPFDLTYLPPTVTPGIVAFRPAALARHLPEHPLAGQAHQFLGMLLTMMTDCEPSAATFPALADIDECVLGLNLSTTFPSPGKRGTFVFGAGSPCSVRTAKPFDWEGAVRKWFPRATKAEHVGRAYLRTPWKTNSPLIPADVAKKAEGRCLGIFIPDNRTLVLGDEDQIKELIDRLKEGKPVPESPGWNEVRRDLVAGVLDQRQAAWTHGDWPKEPDGIEHAHTLVDSMQVAAFGLSLQEGPRGGKLVGRLIATTKDARAAGRSEEAIKALVAMLRTALSEIKEGPGVELAKMLIDVFDHGTLTRDGAIVRGKIEVPARFFQLFMDLATAKEKAEAPPTLPPLPSRYAPPSRPRS